MVFKDCYIGAIKYGNDCKIGNDCYINETKYGND